MREANYQHTYTHLRHALCLIMQTVSRRYQRTLFKPQDPKPTTSRKKHKDGGQGRQTKRMYVYIYVWIPHNADNLAYEKRVDRAAKERKKEGQRAMEGSRPQKTKVMHAGIGPRQTRFLSSQRPKYI